MCPGAAFTSKESHRRSGRVVHPQAAATSNVLWPSLETSHSDTCWHFSDGPSSSHPSNTHAADQLPHLPWETADVWGDPSKQVNGMGKHWPAFP